MLTSQSMLLDLISGRRALEAGTCIKVNLWYFPDRACGAGQSTLLDLIAGRRALEAGARVEGETTRVAFLTQEASPVAEGATMLSHLRRAWAGFASVRVSWCLGDRQGRNFRVAVCPQPFVFSHRGRACTPAVLVLKQTGA